MTYISEFTNATSHMHDYFAVKKVDRVRFHAASVLRAAQLLSTRSTRRTGEAVCSRRRVLELGAVQIGYQLGPSKSGASVRSPLPCCLLPGAGSPQTEQSLSLLQVWR